MANSTNPRHMGIPATSTALWGEHLCAFFTTNLLDLVVPYMKAGLEHNESCLWITGGAHDGYRGVSGVGAGDTRTRNLPHWNVTGLVSGESHDPSCAQRKPSEGPQYVMSSQPR